MSETVSIQHEVEKIAFAKNVNLADLPGAMKFFEDVILGYVANELSERNLRALVYAMRGYLDFLKHADDLRIEQRIAELEGAIHETARR